jgi:hypothetical protein
MNVFKTNPGVRNPHYEITRENFERETGNQPPYELIDESMQKRYYAVCPLCENPIQLIGLYKAIRSSEKPYGKHCGKDIDERLPSHNSYTYHYCPYASHQKAYDNWSAEDIPLTPHTRELYDIFRDYFDCAAYIISETIGVKLSRAVCRNMLKAFSVNKVHLYHGLTINNLPLMAAYFGLSQQSLFGQSVKIGSDLYNGLTEKCPDVDFSEQSNGYARLKTKRFININIRFSLHKQVVSNENLEETITFFVDVDDTKAVFQKVIEIDQSFFLKMIYNADNRQNQFRDFEKLDIAKEILLPI